MNEQYIEDNQIMERYLRGRLSEEEVRDYETYYIEHPEHLDRLQTAEAMLEGYQGLAAKETARVGVMTVLARMLMGRGTMPAWSMPLLAVLVIGLGGWSIYLNQELKTTRLQSMQPRANTPIYELTANRSGDEVRPITLPLGVDMAVLVLDLGLVDGETYDVFLRDGEELLWQGQQFRPDYRGALSLSLPLSLLPEGPVAVIVSDDQGEQARFNLQFKQP